MRYAPLNQSAAIVVVGSLNPAILSPAWLALNHVIDQDELKVADTAVVHREISEFSIDTLRFQVTPQRMLIETTEVPFVRVSDLMVEIFGRLLNHTPIQKFGINYQIHFSVDSATRRIALGRALAPIEPWGEWGKTFESADLSGEGGLRTLIMEQRAIEGRNPASYRRVHIEPSLMMVPPRPTDVYMLVNDHFELEEQANTSLFVDTLSRNFDASMEYGQKIVSSMMDLASRFE